MNSISIELKINCGEKECGNCQHKTVKRTHSELEFATCSIFTNHAGNLGSRELNRAPECLAAQNRSKLKTTFIQSQNEIQQLARGEIFHD